MDTKALKTMFFRQNGILAWIVCLGMLVSNMIVQGINNSFGEIMYSVISDFDSDISSVALIPSVNSFAYYLSGYVCSILVKWYSFRVLVFFGGLSSCIAFAVSFYSTSIASLTISYGVFGGMANGIVYVPGLIACGFYFDEYRRPLATGIATSGNGLGIVVIPILMNYINENFGWRNTMLFLSLISPIICLIALVMLPLSFISVDTVENILPKNALDVENGIENNNNIQASDIKRELEETLQKSSRTPSITDVDTYYLFRQIKQYLMDSWDLLKHPKLIFYYFSHVLWTVAYFIPIDFLNSMMILEHGISVELSGYIIPIMGVANIVGNLFTGLFITKLKLNPIKLHVLYLFGCGVGCYCFTFCTNYSSFVGIAVLYGLFSGPISMLIMECLESYLSHN